MVTLDDILNQIERGETTVHTAESLRYMTSRLFECPECHRLTSDLHGREQVCRECFLAITCTK